jgi:hypothetical protein
MRFNARNLILLLVGAGVAGALIFFGTRDPGDATAPATETAAQPGPLFPQVNTEDVTRFEIRSLAQTSATEEATPPDSDDDAPQPSLVVMQRDEEGIWTITEATNSTDRDADQMIIVGTVGNVVGLQYADSFSVEEAAADLSDFGLSEPAYEIVISDDEADYKLMLGAKNPGGRRYYVQQSDDTDTVYLAPADILDNVVNYIAQPPYIPPPTATPTPFPTANPYSEVEQTATAQAASEATATAQAEAADLGPEAPATETDDN